MTSAPMQPITLMHISDLHIGELDPSTGDADMGPVMRFMSTNTPLFDGLLGHHATGLQHLESFWSRLLADNPGAEVVVSGDVTRWGGWGELNNAHAFLGGMLNAPFGKTGLQFSSWRKRAIPGNHDHWPGVPHVVGPPDPSVKKAFLDNYPRIETLRPGSRKPIHLIAINSDSDVHPSSVYRTGAIGHFQTQLGKAHTQLLKVGDGIRVLLLHHSWNKKNGILSISRSSRGALYQFMEEEGISILMSGHVHTPSIEKIAIGSPGYSRPQRYVWECRCGTTTQVDKMWYTARTLLGNFPQKDKWPANSLLVHRITEDSRGGIKWHVQTFVRDRTGFHPSFANGAHEIISIP